ncbi:MAG: sugar ABC transporter permease [Anaerolineae bacterium]|nr:sugar ABC transporter permease [Anaerolineae bacterium]
MTLRLPTLKTHQREAFDGYLFLLPWIIGFFAFYAGPMLYSLYISFTYTTGVSVPRWIGIDNYRRMFFEDPVFWKSLGNTFFFVGFSVPLTMIFAIFVAMLLNQKIRGMAFFRTIYYLPSVVPAIAASVLWLQIFNTRYGLLNIALEGIGLPRIAWLGDVNAVKPAYVIMSLWNFGAAMVIYLAGLQGIPQELYEAAEIDGAGGLSRIRHITLPLLTPVIFFNLIVGMIGALQYFLPAFIMTNGGPRNASRFFVLHVFFYAFGTLDFSYGATLSWMLLILTAFLTYILFRVVGPRVHYYL